MERAWHIFKVIFSTLLVILATYLFIFTMFSHDVPFDPLNLAIPAGLVLFAAMPWALGEPNENVRAKGLLGIIFSMMFISMAISSFKDEISFPMSCSPRSQIGCDFLNWLHGNFGSSAVGIFIGIVSSLFLVGSVILIRRGGEKT